MYPVWNHDSAGGGGGGGGAPAWRRNRKGKDTISLSKGNLADIYYLMTCGYIHIFKEI